MIVNNGSKDKTGEIADDFAKIDPRVRVVHNTTTLDIIPNWNFSLSQGSQESSYYKVIHADDCLFPDCIERMVRLAEAHPSVGLVSSYRLCGKRVTCDGIPYKCEVMSGKESRQTDTVEQTRGIRISFKHIASFQVC